MAHTPGIIGLVSSSVIDTNNDHISSYVATISMAPTPGIIGLVSSSVIDTNNAAMSLAITSSFPVSPNGVIPNQVQKMSQDMGAVGVIDYFKHWTWLGCV